VGFLSADTPYTQLSILVLVEFEWDARKNKTNTTKHGVNFRDACRIFERPYLEREDDRFDYEETRMIAYGEASGVVLAVVYVWRGETRRLVSARKATRNETMAWYQSIYGEAKKTGEES
jgi:uncharacterized protein